jgi:uncharacterized membrane protein
MSRVWTYRLVLVGVVAVITGVDAAGAGKPPKITDLGGFPGYSTTARGINEAGEIVGERYRSDPDTDTREGQGLLWRKSASGSYFSTELAALTNFPNGYPRSINDSGRIGGWAEAADLTVLAPPAQAVRWERDASGTYEPTDLGTPDGFWYSETASFSEGGHVLNELGRIVGGGAFLLSGPHHAYLWADPGLSPPIDLSPSAGESFFMAYGVNDAGFVVGGSAPSGRAILWEADLAGDYVQVELPMPLGGQRATAHDINDSGQIVGMVDRRAVIWEKSASGHYVAGDLGSPPGGTSSRAYAINDAGDVIGWAAVSESGATFHHAVLWQKDSSGQFAPTVLGALPGITGSDAYGINERGQIVGSASYRDASTNTTSQHAVLWELADTTPPTISGASANPAVLWPPNHTIVDVTVSYEATDDGGSVACSLGPVACNEHFTAEDWQVVDENQLRLRSERYGSGTGRVYTIPITCTDPSGNVVSRPVVVTVPHDQRQ